MVYVVVFLAFDRYPRSSRDILKIFMLSSFLLDCKSIDVENMEAGGFELLQGQDIFSYDFG